MSDFRKKDGKTIQTSEVRQRYLRISYTAILQPEIVPALSFVLKKTGFEYQPGDLQNITPRSGEPVIISDADGNTIHILLQKLGDTRDIPYLIFHTDDCLRDYHKYTTKGVEFLSRPEYRPEGLSANFIGADNKIYTLLEERIYADAL